MLHNDARSCTMSHRAAHQRRIEHDIAVLSSIEHTEAAKRGKREGLSREENWLARSDPEMTTIFRHRKGATPTLLARRMGMGRGGSGLTEWRRKDASDPGRQSEAAEHVLRRVDCFPRFVHEDEPKLGVVCGLNKRESYSPLDRDRAACLLAVIRDEPVCPIPRSNFSRGESINHHRNGLRLVRC